VVEIFCYFVPQERIENALLLYQLRRIATSVLPSFARSLLSPPPLPPRGGGADGGGRIGCV
jgi:hypothetical protein